VAKLIADKDNEKEKLQKIFIGRMPKGEILRMQLCMKQEFI
jgi:hypothetical protein